jgi:hypothetical protein
MREAVLIGTHSVAASEKAEGFLLKRVSVSGY